MPLVAIAAIAAGGAVAAGVATVATISMIGVGMAVVGHVTKSRELSQIGTGMSLGAGVAGLAQGFMGAAEGASAASAGSGDAAFDTWANQQGAAEAATGAEDLMTGSQPSWASGAAETANSGATQGLLNATKTPAADALTSNTATPEIGEAASGLSKAETMAGALPKPTGTDPGSISQWWSGLKESTKNSIITTGGNMLSGMFAGWSEEEKLALQREMMNLNQQNHNTSMANASAQPKIARSPVSTGGLLNAVRG